MGRAQNGRPEMGGPEMAGPEMGYTRFKLQEVEQDTPYSWDLTSLDPPIISKKMTFKVQVLEIFIRFSLELSAFNVRGVLNNFLNVECTL